MIHLAASGPTRPRSAGAPPFRLLALGLAAVVFAVLLLWLNASAGHAAPIDPAAPVVPTDPANPENGNVNIEINGADGKPSTAVLTLVGITLLAVAPVAAADDDVLHQDLRGPGDDPQRAVPAVHPAEPGSGGAGPVPLAVHHVARPQRDEHHRRSALPQRHPGLQRCGQRRVGSAAALHARPHPRRGPRPDDPRRRAPRTRPRRRPSRC